MILVPSEGQIAVVDDNEIERMILRRVLNMSNLINPVVEFPSAVSFLQELDGRIELGDVGFALVLMDINMPVMTGLEALAKIRGRRSVEDLKISIMVASSEARSDMTAAENLGADSYVVKQAGIEKYVEEININFVNQATT